MHKVVFDLRRTVPEATIYIYDNLSTDHTAAVAAAADAVVRTEPRRGKGSVVRRAFADIDADIYILIDGDDTYDADAAPAMIAALRDGPLDHVLGVRQQTAAQAHTAPVTKPGTRCSIGWSASFSASQSRTC